MSTCFLLLVCYPVLASYNSNVAPNILENTQENQKSSVFINIYTLKGNSLLTIGFQSASIALILITGIYKVKAKYNTFYHGFNILAAVLYVVAAIIPIISPTSFNKYNFYDFSNLLLVISSFFSLIMDAV